MSLENPNLNNEGHKHTPVDNALHEEEGISKSIESMAGKLGEATLEITQTIESSSLPPEQKEKFKKRLESKVRKILRIFSFATALTGTAGIVTGIATYQATRYKVESKIISTGKIEYLHEDKETTHILNILSGKEDLNDEDKRDIMIDFLTDRIESLQMEGRSIKPNELTEKSLDELSQLVDIILRIDHPVDKPLSLEAKLKKIRPSPTLPTFDPELYTALWELEKECGNPKVRFRLGPKKDILGFGDIAGVSFYRPDINTVHIEMLKNTESIDYYIAELSHAKQFNEKPVSSVLKGAHDVLNIANEALIGGDKKEKGDRHNLGDEAYMAHGKLYDKPGTIEHEAHNIIEPELWKKLKNLTPIRSKKEEHNNEIEEKIKIEFKKLDEEKQAKINELYRDYFVAKRDTKAENRAAFEAFYTKEEGKIIKIFNSKKESLATKLRSARK